MRRGTAVGTAVVLVLEAVGIGFVNWILGLAVRHQNMSLAGQSSDLLSVGAWVAGGVFGLFLIGCAVLVVRIVRQDRMTGRFARNVLIGCAVVHGVLGAAVVGLVGWWAFVVMMVILGLLVATLVLYTPQGPGKAAPTQPGAGQVPPPAAV